MVQHYAEIYSFDMGADGKTSYNNEGDAFKHCFMQAELTFWFGQRIAEYIGIKHEDNNPLNNDKERNMDLWNNKQGREIGQRYRKLRNYSKLLRVYSGIAYDIMAKMRAEELITDINDERKYEE